MSGLAHDLLQREPRWGRKVKDAILQESTLATRGAIRLQTEVLTDLHRRRRGGVSS